MFGLTPSPFLLSDTVAAHMEKYRKVYEEIIQKFLRDLYMDDSITGSQKKDDLFKIYEVVKKLMLEGGFDLRKWMCNDEELQQKILKSESEIYHETENFVKPEMNVLGVSWRPREDEFVFSVKEVVLDALKYNGPITKRHMVKITASHYDPIGVLSPVTVQFKFIIQEVCKLKFSWDEEVTEDLARKWRKLLRHCVDLQPTVIKRNYLNLWNLSDVTDIQLHGFADASMKAYACIVYLRFTLKNGNIVIAFVSSKTRVAPIKQITLPRLELMACVLLVDLIKVVLNSCVDYVINSVYCWSDNTDCLSWIRCKDKIQPKFVQRRAAKIREDIPEAT